MSPRIDQGLSRLVSVVDDDESVRESLPDLLRVAGFQVRTYESAEAFLASDWIAETRCLILDITLTGLSGPDLMRELVESSRRIPTIFITAHGNELIRQQVLGAGAVACLFKPFSDTSLFAALDAALRVRE